MRVLPLVLHAGARVPALTSLFSTPLAATTLSVVAGGITTLTTTRPHGYATGAAVALSVVDSDVPNPVTAAVVLQGGRVQITTRYEHDLSIEPDGASVQSWNLVAVLRGFANAALNGDVQLVSVDSRTQFTVLPAYGVSSIALTGTESLLERLEDGVIGWHSMTVVDDTTLTFPTPADVGRDYVVTQPGVVTNVRVAGALNLDAAWQQYQRGYRPNARQQDEQSLTEAWMFITPPPSVQLSRDRESRSDAIAEITPAADYRQLLLDGFHIYVFLPAEQSGSGLACSDLAHGEVLATVLRTFHGLVLPRAELYQANKFVSLMIEHGQALGDYNKATYVHGYVFQAPAYLTQWDSIQPFEWSAIDEQRLTASSGVGPGNPGGLLRPGTTTIAPAGSVRFREIEIGMRHDEAIQPLLVTVDLQ